MMLLFLIVGVVNASRASNAASRDFASASYAFIFFIDVFCVVGVVCVDVYCIDVVVCIVCLSVFVMGGG